jgi:hypothetical protein
MKGLGSFEAAGKQEMLGVRRHRRGQTSAIEKGFFGYYPDRVPKTRSDHGPEVGMKKSRIHEGP